MTVFTRTLARSASHVSLAIAVTLGLFLVLILSSAVESAIFFISPSPYSPTIDEQRIVRRSVRDFLFRGTSLSADIFTEREREHMADVRRIFIITAGIFLFSTALFAASMPFLHLFGEEVSRFFRSHSSGAFVAVIVAASAAAFFFEDFFYVFHLVAFSNDLWLLDPQVHALIRVYHPLYFRSFVAVYLVVLVLIYLSAALVLSKNRKTHL